MRGDASVKVVDFSPDGSRLARAEGNLVVVCDTTTGFVECTLSGHTYAPPPVTLLDFKFEQNMACADVLLILQC